MSDEALRLRERSGLLTMRDLYLLGRLAAIKRLAICGNVEARRFLGFTRKPKVHLFDVLWAMWHQCPERVSQFLILHRRHRIEEPRSRGRKDGTFPRYSFRHWLISEAPSRRRQQWLLARDLGLMGHGCPGFWWSGRELAKLGKIL